MRKLTIGEVFAGDYRVERPLAEGGMGAVYVALQLSTGRRRALKLMHPRLVKDPKLRARFEREARVGADISSDHVVEVVAAGVDEASGAPFLAMELLEGLDLHALVARRGPLPRDEVSRMAAQIAHALAAAHAAGVVHRDLKPENVFLVEERREGGGSSVKVLDFGIAKAITDSDQASRTAPVGTPLWMAPEQATAGAAITPATDVWAFGLLVYWMLTGSIYWAAAHAAEVSALAVLREVAVDPLEPASERATAQGWEGALPEGFDAWFERCVVREPGDRFPEAGAAMVALRPLLGDASDGASSSRLALAATLPAMPPPRADGRLSDAFAPTAAALPTTPPGDLPVIPTALPASGPSPLAAAPAATAPTGGGRGRVAIAVALVAAGGVIASSWLGGPPSSATSSAPSASAPPGGSTAIDPGPSPRAAASPSAASSPSASQSHRHLFTDPAVRWRVPIEGAPRHGSPAPLVTVVEFGNLQCPGSRIAARWVRELVDARGEDLALVWREDPLAMHSRATVAAHLAREAGDQLGDEGFWKVVAKVGVARRFDDATLSGIADELGMKPGSFEAAVAARRHMPAIDRDIDLADGLGASDTPTLFVNGRRFLGTPSQEAVAALIEEELAVARAALARGVPRAGILDELTRGSPGPMPMERVTLPSQLVETTEVEAEPAVVVAAIGDHTDPFATRQHEAVAALVARRGPEVGMSFIEHVKPEKQASMQVGAALLEAFDQKGAPGFKAMRRLVIDQPAGLELSALLQYAQQAQLDPARMKSVIGERTHDSVLLAAARKLDGHGLTEVPTYVVCAGGDCQLGGYLLAGLHSERSFEVRIDKALAESKER